MGLNNMDKKDIHYNVSDLGYFHDKNGDIHFAIKCDNCVYDIRDKVLRGVEDENPFQIKVHPDPCYGYEPERYVLCDGYNVLVNGLPELDVFSEYANLRLYILESKLEEYVGRTDYSLRELEKINKMYAKFYEIKNNIFQRISNKVYLSAKRALERDEKLAKKAKTEDTQQKDL